MGFGGGFVHLGDVLGACHGVVGSAAVLTAAEGDDGADGVARVASCLDVIGSATARKLGLPSETRAKSATASGLFCVRFRECYFANLRLAK